MSEWTATARANATPCQLLQVLTLPDEIRRWSPVDFDLDDLDGSRLAAGTRGRVTGRLAGVKVGFDVEIHAADEAILELSADGPVGLDVRYELTKDDSGAELIASVSMRRGGGITGRLVANAAAALLSAGALEGAAARIAEVAESQRRAAAVEGTARHAFTHELASRPTLDLKSRSSAPPPATVVMGGDKCPSETFSRLISERSD
jgi:hypothetical protein